jgi:hypothetical protein
MQILADAISRAGVVRQAPSVTPAATDMDTVIGPVTFEADSTAQSWTSRQSVAGRKTGACRPLEQPNASKIIYPLVPWKDR